MGLFETFYYYWTEKADPRSRDWLLIGSSYQIPLIMFVYLYTVFYWGPRYMKDKPPYDLRTFIKFYNLLQIVANAWLVREYITVEWLITIPLTCSALRYSYEPHKYKITVILWWTLLLKILDLTETVLFVLRKKNEQISVLHIYHHVSTVIIICIFMKYTANEIITLVPLLNCSVHFIMYNYYLFSSFGPRIRMIIAPCKRYITIIQMVQFCILIAYAAQSSLSDCKSVRNLGYIFILNVTINLCLFYKFYQRTYITKAK
ncbi:elongation of very long chain fatty acids protein AAEL008004-like [Harpegnathos saltator]|uniref:elongation of very long chain fatty acids protein AAEL008004-like n=1 Tax=Harpegnathos saltator TaxID=610380 RepID=UPI00058FFAF3|nr:elongation of very long chain fatty acids protein AAEL008004-like [Harpegnathos saltator]